MKSSLDEKYGSIAILSMQRIVNFGSVLQAYSLRGIIEEITGIRAVFLEIEDVPAIASVQRMEEIDDYAEPACYPSGLFQRGKRWLIAKLSAYNKWLIRAFMKDELKLNADHNSDYYEVVVVGSDEVFNHAGGIRLQLHGEVKQGRKVISYAACCGSARLEDIPKEAVQRVRNAMAHFSALSVRDAETQRYVSSLYNGEIHQHLDPVLVGGLAERTACKVPVKNYLLVYAYGQRIRTKEEILAIRSFAKARGLKIVAVGGSQFWCDFYIPVKPFRMLDYFHAADYVVTDTFHGAVFSIINHRKFVVLPRKSNIAKIDGLLKSVGLSEQKLVSMLDIDMVLSREIDYSRVDAFLAKERLRMQEYLKRELEKQR